MVRGTDTWPGVGEMELVTKTGLAKAARQGTILGPYLGVRWFGFW